MRPANRRYKSTARKGPDTSTWTPAQRMEADLAAAKKKPIAELDLSVRAINTLEDYDVLLVEDLLAQTYESLSAMANFGDKTLDEVRAAVRKLGLAPPEWKKPPKPPKKPRPRGSRNQFEIW